MRRNLAVSCGETSVVPFSFRFRLRSLLVKMCALNALPRLNLPVAVFLKRLAAPRWLLSLGMFLRFLRFLPLPSIPSLLADFGLLRRRFLHSHLLREDRMHLVAFLAR